MKPATFRYRTKGGFTGKKPDKLGREMCYQEGIHVPCGTNPPQVGQSPLRGGHREGYDEGSGRTENEKQDFQKWFEGSKVIDKEGKPLKMYHGSKEKIDSFSLGHHGKTTKTANSSWGIFFTPDAKEGKRYAQFGHYGEGHVHEVFLNIKNPYRMSGREFARYSVQGMDKEIRAFKEKLVKEGFDGIHIDKGGEVDDYHGGKINIDEWVAFDPKQIRIVSGLGSEDPGTEEVSE